MRWLLVVLFSITNAYAAPSLLGICHKDFPCNRVNDLYQGLAQVELSWLETTFGRECKCLISLLDDARPKVLRVHLMNSPCMRNKRCGRSEALWGYAAASGSRAALQPRSRLRRRFARTLEQFKARIGDRQVTCYVSPCLECDLYERPRRELANLVSTSLPNCTIVDNPYRRRCLAGYTCEKHGPNPNLSAPCIVDLDGVDGSTVDVKKYVEQYQHCDLTYYWEPFMNCNASAASQFVSPLGRTCGSQLNNFSRVKGILCRYFYPSLDICSR